MTVVGRDRPGIIADLSGILAGLGFNLTDTTMTLLRGHFTMTLMCAGDVAAERVRAELEPMAATGSLTVSVRAVEPDPRRVPPDATDLGMRVNGSAPYPASLPDNVPYVLTVYGADRLGIVAELTRVVADSGGNITDLTTRLSGDLYLLIAEVDLDAETDLATLRGNLQEAALALGVDASLRPVDADVL